MVSMSVRPATQGARTLGVSAQTVAPEPEIDDDSWDGDAMRGWSAYFYLCPDGGDVPYDDQECTYRAQIYTPNWVRFGVPTVVCLDEGPVRLEGDRTRLVGVLDLGDGTQKRFRITDSTFGDVVVDPVDNIYLCQGRSHAGSAQRLLPCAVALRASL